MAGLTCDCGELVATCDINEGYSVLTYVICAAVVTVLWHMFTPRVFLKNVSMHRPRGVCPHRVRGAAAPRARGPAARARPSARLQLSNLRRSAVSVAARQAQGTSTQSAWQLSTA